MTNKGNPEAMKWPTDKPRYDENYLRLYGKLCIVCNGYGYIWGEEKDTEIHCFNCDGLGYVEKSK